MLNYIPHAIEELRLATKGMAADTRDEDARQTGIFIDQLRSSQKFILPDHGSLIWDMASVPEGLEMTRLPYPVTAFEAPFPRTGQDIGDLLHSSRRIILAEEAVLDGRGLGPARGLELPTHVRISIVCWMDQTRQWFLTPYAALIAIGTTASVHDLPDDDPFEHNRIGRVSFPFQGVPLLPQVDAFLRRQHGERGYGHVLSNDLGTEIRIVAETLAVLGCRNVTTETVSPPPKLARARERNRREPLHDYHVLVVGDATLSDRAGAHGGADEDGFKVRQHLRRGHIRRLSPTHRVWVNQTVVAPGSERGRTDKTYRVRTQGSDGRQ